MAALLLIHAAELAAGLDFRDYDDLVRSVLARTWWRAPYFISADGYWPTLPAILRGSLLGLFAPVALPRPDLALFLIRLVTLAMMWGCWRLLASLTRLLGGGDLAVALLTACFIFNAGTTHFAASAYSEPDGFFYLLLALVLLISNLQSTISNLERVGTPALPGNPQSAIRNPQILMGVALAAGCLTRYEAWSYYLLFLVLSVGRFRRKRHGFEPADEHVTSGGSDLRTLIGLLLPAAAMGVWIYFQVRRFGAPFHFLEVGRPYNHFSTSAHHFALAVGYTARKFLAMHPLWVPLALALGGAELVRRRRESRVAAFALVTALTFAWAFYRLWGIYFMVRYLWDAVLLAAVPAAVAAERLLARTRHARPVSIVFTIAIFVVFVGLFARLQPYPDPGLRAFARAVQRQTSGQILLCDHLDAARAPDLQLFRLMIQNERLDQSDWIAAPPTPELLQSRRIHYLLARQPRPALTSSPPVLSGAGWSLWRTK